MTLLLIFKALVYTIQFISKFISDKQLIELGETKLLSEQLEAVNEKVKKAIQARSDSFSSTNGDGLREKDEYLRD